LTRAGPSSGVMKDLIFVGISVLFFAVAWLYVRACERA
jgi:hypothetical protein